MARGKGNNSTNNKGATLGFEATLWAAADKLRNNIANVLTPGRHVGAEALEEDG
jgi:hypothetical protein